ncbi:DUF3499 domain-containing protein [Brevibacterium sp. 50QC2O2]|uniref:DUF3499 domain-containing protein n=1 Tax=Brevibacterium TaxID=1696 RepID=UPI00211C41F1|nr:DUF3499 domain-containing protein [Brevibacterium sp. 91QC2O2]MCQ9385934.1 DUF3499 domain-containing protein [Brevibacterium sp. 68QC2CO]MCQ9387400.1 DUF3499 domain-containing protein [Brevibacterium sp. 50QC2O2]
MPGVRTCSKTNCSRAASRTLTYVHADACVVIGPLSVRAEPGAHDLCQYHADRLTAPRGWELIRLDGGAEVPERSRDDLLAIADAVREAAAPRPQPPVPPRTGRPRLRLIGGDE